METAPPGIVRGRDVTYTWWGPLLPAFPSVREPASNLGVQLRDVFKILSPGCLDSSPGHQVPAVWPGQGTKLSLSLRFLHCDKRTILGPTPEAGIFVIP